MNRTWRRVAISAIAITLLALIAAGALVFDSPATVVILVRHAERAATPPDDPPLSPAGQQRAQTLAHVTGQAGVTAIFATEFQRTQQTVQPLAAQLGIAATVVNADDVNGLVSQIRSRRGATVVAAGHSDTIPQIIGKLGGGTIGSIAETEFDNLFVVTIPRWGNTRVVRLQYGNPTRGGVN